MAGKRDSVLLCHDQLHEGLFSFNVRATRFLMKPLTSGMLNRKHVVSMNSPVQCSSPAQLRIPFCQGEGEESWKLLRKRNQSSGLQIKRSLGCRLYRY